MKTASAKVIGLGGIGTALLPVLCRMLEHGGKRWTLALVDGDAYERKNAARQSFRTLGEKAVVKAKELAPAFKNIRFRSIARYATAENVERLIREGDTVFLCVDNHATRKLVSDRCRKLAAVTLISGGNDLTDGNVQVYLRRKGSDVTLPLDVLHPEIRDPRDAVPGASRRGCEARIREGAKQLLVANAAAAFGMLMNFWRIEEGLTEGIGETYFTLPKGLVETMPRPAQRRQS